MMEVSSLGLKLGDKFARWRWAGFLKYSHHRLTVVQHGSHITSRVENRTDSSLIPRPATF